MKLLRLFTLFLCIVLTFGMTASCTAEGYNEPDLAAYVK